MSGWNATLTAPSYAPDGSRGYLITATRQQWVSNAVDGAREITLTVTGWFTHSDDGRAIATLDGGAWQYVTVQAEGATLKFTYDGVPVTAVLTNEGK